MLSGVLLVACVLGVLAVLAIWAARSPRAEPIDPECAIGLSQYELAVLDHGDPAELELATPVFDWPESGQGYTLDSVLTLRNGGESNPAAGRSGTSERK